MPTLEVFFDYACPYCLRGHDILTELLPLYPALDLVWRPCEAHPRPDRYGPHSDLCARGMFYAQDHGIDLMEYHRRMYRAALVDRADIEDPQVVAHLLEGLTDSSLFLDALTGGLYVDRLLENNRLAWIIHDFPAVPSFHMNGDLLKSMEDVGVTKLRLEQFLQTHM